MLTKRASRKGCSGGHHQQQLLLSKPRPTNTQEESPQQLVLLVGSEILACNVAWLDRASQLLHADWIDSAQRVRRRRNNSIDGFSFSVRFFISPATSFVLLSLLFTQGLRCASTAILKKRGLPAQRFGTEKGHNFHTAMA